MELVGEGGPAPVGGQRERALLARLLLSPNQVVSSAALTDDLWSGAPTEGAAQALWVHVSRLRKALRDQGGDEVLVTRPPGYLLQIAPEAIDSYRFEALVDRGRSLAAGGDPAAAADAFRQALALWRGAALADVADTAFAQAEAVRLEEARLAALEARIEADLAAGAAGDLIGELSSLTREHPLRERLWALRMTALYRAGRQAEALRTYQELRRYLGEELGIDPSDELRALEGAILRQEAHLARPQTPPTPGAAGPSTPGVVTFMFTDLVGSTELLDRLGDEAADDLRRQHFASLRQALTAHGGTEVKSLGDGLMAAFASPVAALRCAVEIQQTAADEGGPTSGAIRIGLHAGEPIADDDDFFGAPVVVAQRLCGRARGGQILASTLVQGLAGNRAGCSFTTLGGLTLKGFSEPVAASEVHWALPTVREAVPLPVSLARQDAVFVRPDADMAQLEANWERAHSGRRQLALLAGEPGIGKTRLSAEIARASHANGAIVLYGRCEDGMAVPYQPFVEALGTYLRQAAAPVLGRLAGELARLVPELGERFPDLPPPLSADPETERYRLFDAVAAWLAAVADEAPTVLVVEDLHWATPPTLAMLRHLIHSDEPGRLLVVANYRDTQLDVTPELADAVADLLRQPDVDRIRLGGFDPGEVVAYMEARARHELDEEGREFASVLHVETAGNPFFLSQLLRHLTETGAVTRSEGRWSAGSGANVDVPDSVRDVIARRMARLPDETREMLTLGAVQGDRFDLRVLVEAAAEPQISVLRALDPAISARFLTEAGGPEPAHRFVHALVRHTLYDALSAARRMELHRAVGTALASVAGENWPDHAADLARHWLAATPHVGATPEEARRTLDYAEEAARRASASLAYEEAAAQLVRALPLLDLIDDPQRRATMLVGLGEAQYNAGDGAHRKTLLEAGYQALQLGEGALAARAALANQRPTVLFGAVDPERVALLEAVLAALGPGDSTARARLLVTLACELHHSPDPRRHGFAREAVAVARRVADPSCLAHVLGSAWFALWALESLPERVEIAAEMSGLVEEQADPVLQIHAGLTLYLSAAQQGDLATARAALWKAIRLAEELGQPALRFRAAGAQAQCAMLDGRFNDTEHLAAKGLQLAEALGFHEGLAMYHSQMAVLRLLQGRQAEFLEHTTAAADRYPIAAVKAGLAWVLAEVGRTAEARTILDAIAGPSRHGIPADYVQQMALLFLAGAAIAIDDVALARRIHLELLPYGDQVTVGTSVAFGPVAHYLGRLAAFLGYLDEADDHFNYAATLQERTGARGWLTHTRLEWARLLLERGKPGDHEKARALAEAAAALADELDTPALLDQARDLLAASLRPG